MSMRLIELQAYTPILPAVDLALVRDAFRREREARVGSRTKLVELTGREGGPPIDESTIFRIETDDTYIPGIDPFLRLIEAMPNLTPSEFFARLNWSEKDRIDRPRQPGPNHGGDDSL